MNIINPKTQSGFALLVFLIVLMGLGGLALTGFSQQALKEVQVKKFEHNKRVLEEAKQALLQFAYNYPATNGNGPGRLPCPDTNNDGTPNTPINCSTFIGRLPWNQPNLNLADIRDADGQRLWYAVSSNFSTQEATNLNSSTFGTLTVRDQSGNVIYDGSTADAGSGVAAVIIAPGPVTSRNGVSQDRSVIDDDPFDTAADDDPGVINAVNYLDRIVGVEDNADFAQSSPTNGFVLGPVEGNAIDAVNDQLIIITAAEVIEMAEKATLQAYRDAINGYLANTGDVYPWLYNYQGVPDVPGLSSFFPADATFANELANNLDNFGRIPSIFANYFTDTDSRPIESELSGTIVFSYPATPAKVDHSSGGGDFEFAAGAEHTLDFQTANILTDVRFVDLPLDDGRLRATTPGEPTFSQTVFFWENQSSGNGFWTICEPPADDVTDCNRDNLGNLPSGSNDFDSEILKITINLNFSPGAIFFDVDYNPDPIIAGPVYTAATGTGHAQISVTYDGAAIDSTALTLLSATFEIDDNYDAGESSFSVTDFGDLDDITQLNFDSLELSIRYYPELPDWAFDNDWHNAIMMAYANNYRPDVAGAAGDCVTNPPCFQINGLSGVNNDKVSLLVLAGEHNWTDGDLSPVKAVDGSFSDELGDVFNLENSDLDNVFDIRTVENTGAPGDIQLDKIMLIR